MKLITTILCVSLMTLFVACNNKKGGGGAPQNPYTYPAGMPGAIPLQQGLTLNLPNCSVPPPMFMDLFQMCSWLATTNDCDRNAVDYVFTQRCFNLGLARPGCVFPPQPVIASCGSACVSSSKPFDRQTIRETRERYTRPSKPSRQDTIRVREPAQPSSSSVSAGSTKEIIVHSNPSPNRVVIADRVTGPDNSRNLPKECKGNVVRDCRYKRAFESFRTSALRRFPRDIIAPDLEVARNQPQSSSVFYKNVEKGNVECRHASTKNRYTLSLFDYIAALQNACFGGSSGAPTEIPVPDSHGNVGVEAPSAPVKSEARSTSPAETFPLVDNPPTKTEPLKASFDSSKCQWIVELHNQLREGNGFESFARQFTTNPSFDARVQSINDLAKDLCVIGHQRFQFGNANGDVHERSAIGLGVRIEGDQLITHPDLNETIISCDLRSIKTQFEFNGSKVTKQYDWNGRKDNRGRIDVRSDITIERDGQISQYSTYRPIIWKKGIHDIGPLQDDPRYKDFRIGPAGSIGTNTANLSKRTNLRFDKNGQPICEGIRMIPN